MTILFYTGGSCSGCNVWIYTIIGPNGHFHHSSLYIICLWDNSLKNNCLDHFLNCLLFRVQFIFNHTIFYSLALFPRIPHSWVLRSTAQQPLIPRIPYWVRAIHKFQKVSSIILSNSFFLPPRAVRHNSGHMLFSSLLPASCTAEYMGSDMQNMMPVKQQDQVQLQMVWTESQSELQYLSW